MAIDLTFLRRLAPVASWRALPPLVTVVRLSGIIAGGQLPLQGGVLNLGTLAPVLERAFSIPGLKAVALAINSPGGSPVQSALIGGRIRQLADEKKVPVLAFVEDVAASGGYWLAAAADEIYADANSIVGSIGVIRSGFGFTGLIERLGVERRVHTAGENKSFHDAFRPEKPEDVERLDRIMGQTHRTFIDYVRARRGAKLAQPEDPRLFSGDFWLGQEAKQLGLIDGIGDLHSTLRARFGERVRMIPVGRGRPWWRRFGYAGAGGDFSSQVFGAAEGAMAALEARALWNRYGL